MIRSSHFPAKAGPQSEISNFPFDTTGNYLMAIDIKEVLVNKFSVKGRSPLWFLVVSSGKRRVIRRVEVAMFPCRAPGSRLAAGHPKGLALTRANGNQRSPKACRARFFWPASLTAEGDSLPSRWREGRGDGWGNDSPVPPLATALITG